MLLPLNLAHGSIPVCMCDGLSTFGIMWRFQCLLYPVVVVGSSFNYLYIIRFLCLLYSVLKFVFLQYWRKESGLRCSFRNSSNNTSPVFYNVVLLLLGPWFKVRQDEHIWWLPADGERRRRPLPLERKRYKRHQNCSRDGCQVLGIWTGSCSHCFAGDSMITCITYRNCFSELLIFAT